MSFERPLPGPNSPRSDLAPPATVASNARRRLRARPLWALASLFLMLGTGHSHAQPTDSDNPTLAGTGETPMSGDWVIIRIASEPLHLNPVASSESTASMIFDEIFEGLVAFNAQNEIVPHLAHRWESSPQGTEIIFHLDPRARWADGRPVTASDVLFTVERIRDPAWRAANKRSDFAPLQSLDALDSLTVRARYAEPTPLALQTWDIAIIPRHLYDQPFEGHPLNRQPIGSGPYQLREWVPGRHIITERRGDYWGDTGGYLERIVYKLIPNSTAAFLALKKGDIDLLAVRPVLWDRSTGDAQLDDRFHRLSYYIDGFTYLGWQCDASRGPFFHDPRVRRAMTLTVNRTNFVQKTLRGYGRAVTGPFYPDSPYCDSSLVPLPFDPTAAAALLTAAGWEDHDGDGLRDKDGTPFRFIALMPTGVSDWEALLNAFREDLKVLGVEMQIQRYEWGTFYERVQNRDFQMYVIRQNNGQGIPEVYDSWHSSEAETGFNRCGLKDANLDRALERYRSTLDPDDRKAQARKIHGMLHELQPVTFVSQSRSLVAVDKRLRNVIPSPAGVQRYYPGPLQWWVPLSEHRYSATSAP